MLNIYTTISGDQWDYVALKTLGSEKYTSVLIEANLNYINTVIFESGVELIVPPIKTVKLSSLPPWKK